MENQKTNAIYDYRKIIEPKITEEVPIRRGCPNRQCFCSGQCQEIVGWRPKTAGEIRDERQIRFHLNTENPERSHFEDIEPASWLDNCKDPEHKPPMHIHIPHGKRYVHICPKCGQRVVLQPPQISWGGSVKSAEDVLKESGLDFDWMSSRYTKNTILMTMEAYANQFKSNLR